MKNFRNPAHLGLSVAFLGLAFCAAPAAAEPVGFVAGIEGHVEIQPGGATSWTAAAVDAEVEIGDTLRTGLDSAIKIVLVDDTTLSLGEDTELVLDSFVVGPAATREASVLRHLKGQIRARVGEAFGGTTRVEIHTPTAVMGVKGTELSSRIDTTGGETTTLGCNWEGGVFMYRLGDKTRMDVPLNLCRRAWTDRIGPPIPVPSNFVPVKTPSGKLGPKGLQAVLLGSGDGGFLVSNNPVSLGPEDMPELPPEFEPPLSSDDDIAGLRAGGGISVGEDPGNATPGNP